MPILGTSPDAIDLAEDRDRFKRLLDKLGLKQPKNGIAYSVEQARLIAAELGLPLRRAPVLRARRPRHGDHPRRGAVRGLPARHPAEPGPVATSRRAIRTTRPARSTRCSARTRCCSTATSRTRSRSTSTASATARTCSSPASWSISRRPASIRATRACSLPPRSLSPETIAELERQTHGAGAGARRRRADERAVRASRTATSTCSRSTRAPRAPCPSSPRSSASRSPRSRRASWRARASPRFGLDAEGARPYRRQGGGVPLRPLPRRRHAARPGDALDRRGHRPRPRFGVAFAKSQLGAGTKRAARPARVFVSVRDADKAAILPAVQAAGRPRLQDRRDRRHAALPRGERRRRPRRSTRCWKAARTSSTPSRTARSSSSSTRPRARGAVGLALAAPRRPLA